MSWVPNEFIGILKINFFDVTNKKNSKNDY